MQNATMTRDDRDRDDLFERLEEMFEEFELEERLEELEDKLEDLSEQRGSGQNPFSGGDNPFGGNPFGGNPFGGGDNPFDGNPFSGGDNPFSDLREKAEEVEDSQGGQVVEEDGDVVVYVELPEFTEDQVELTADPERVRVEAHATDDMFHDDVSQVFELPSEVQPEQADATFENGFLTVRLPQVEPDDQTTITIE